LVRYSRANTQGESSVVPAGRSSETRSPETAPLCLSPLLRVSRLPRAPPLRSVDPKAERYNTMAPLLGSRVPTALTEQRASRQGVPTPPTQPHPRGLLTSSARCGPPNLPAILQTGTLMGFHPSELPSSERSRARCPGSLPSRCSSQRPPPEIQTMRRSLKALLPARVRHPPRVFTPLAGRCSRGFVPLQRFSPPRSRIPSDQPSCTLGDKTAEAGKPTWTTGRCPNEGSDCLSRGFRRSWGL